MKCERIWNPIFEREIIATIVKPAIILAFLPLLSCVPNKSTSIGVAAAPRTIEVGLGANIQSIKGLQWSKYKDGRPFELIAEEDPVEMTLNFPSGNKLAITSKIAFISQEMEIITGATIFPLPAAVDFPEAVVEVERIGRLLNLAEDPKFQQKIEEWQRVNPPQSGIFAMRLAVEPKVFVRIEVKKNYDKDNYFVIFEFSIEL